MAQLKRGNESSLTNAMMMERYAKEHPEVVYQPGDETRPQVMDAKAQATQPLTQALASVPTAVGAEVLGVLYPEENGEYSMLYAAPVAIREGSLIDTLLRKLWHEFQSGLSKATGEKRVVGRSDPLGVAASQMESALKLWFPHQMSGNTTPLRTAEGVIDLTTPNLNIASVVRDAVQTLEKSESLEATRTAIRNLDLMYRLTTALGLLVPNVYKSSDGQLRYASVMKGAVPGIHPYLIAEHLGLDARYEKVRAQVTWFLQTLQVHFVTMLVQTVQVPNRHRPVPLHDLLRHRYGRSYGEACPPEAEGFRLFR